MRSREAIPPAPEAVTPPAASGPPDFQAPRPDPALTAPMPLPEPAGLPMPGPMPQVSSPAPGTGMSRVPRSGAPVAAAPDGTREIPMTRDDGPGLSPGPGPDGGEMPINPGDATAEAAPTPPRAGPDAAQPGAGRAIAAGAPVSRAPAGLNEADRLFQARRFDEAGRIYAALAKRNQLPVERRPHWAYCRFEAVVRRINARPRSAREWDTIEAEVRSIQRLTPGNWYAEYLINKIAEARQARRRPAAASDGMVVRGSAPEEPSPQLQPEARSQPPAPAPSRRRTLGRSRGPAAVTEQPANPAEGLAPDQTLNLPGNLSGPDPRPAAEAGDEPKPDPTPAPTPAPDGAEASSRTDDASRVVGAGEAKESGAIAWQVHETPNFRIYHCDPALAERAAAVAEAVRTEQARRWKSPATRTPWSPRCELYLYPTARSYAEATGQPETSPGISAMSNNGVRVLSRRMNLRVDNPLVLTTTLPHEVTHIVLADLFIVQQIPRWADEGIAVLAEPAAEQHHRQADLKEPLDAGRVFKVGQLMTMDYPNPSDWRLFYAQSVSLTHFLVEQGPPERFIQFVRDSHAHSARRPRCATSTRSTDSPPSRRRWLDYARKHVAVDVASGRDAGTASDGVSRD